MKDKQPDTQLYRLYYERLNRKTAKEFNTMREPNDEQIGNWYLSGSGHLAFMNVKRTLTEALMALTHWVSNDRNRRGTTLGHSPCNERNQQLIVINT